MENTELIQRFDKLQKKRDEANTTVIQLQAKVDNANEAIRQIEEGWKVQYGFSTYDEAVKKLEELNAKITSTMDMAEEYLRSVEGDVDGSSEI